MLDDHTPFLEAGIPAIDIIDFDYPYWHTVQDTPDKVSAESLKAVGETCTHGSCNKAGNPDKIILDCGP
jgi:glutaminyl-peptide cyclotransferase